jgi:flagellin
MSLNSVNTNVGAMIALQNLNSTNSQLQETQNQINTGLKVSSAKDNGAVYAIAQNQRATSNSLNAVMDSLNRGKSTIDVALSAASRVSDLLSQMKEKALAASDTTLDSASRTALNDEFKSLRDQIGKVVSNADFNGSNMIKSSGTTVKALAKSAIDKISKAQGTATNKLASLGTTSTGLDTHLTFVGKLQDSLDAGVGNLVDADLAKESAKLQSLQTKQQLGIQALSIANQSTGSILSLFR